MTTLAERVAARMRSEGWTPARIQDLIREAQARESAEPRYHALKPETRLTMLSRAGQILGLEAKTVAGQCADIYIYPTPIIYAWSDTRVTIVDEAGATLTRDRDTPYWSQIAAWTAGERD